MQRLLTEAEAEAADYALAHGYGPTAQRYGLSAARIRDLIARRKSQKAGGAPQKFVEIKGLAGEGVVSFSIGGARISMAVADFRRAFLDD